MNMLIFTVLFIFIQTLTTENFEIMQKVLDQGGRPLEPATVFYREKL